MKSLKFDGVEILPQADVKPLNCDKCHGFKGEPGQIYGYAGKWCNCWMNDQHRAVDDKKWAERDAAMQERISRMKTDYDKKTNEERVKNCKYVHISGSGNCRKCGGVHDITKFNPQLQEGYDMVTKNLTKKPGEE